MSLIDHLPAGADAEAVLDTFVDWVADQGLDLYPHQEEALLEVLAGSNVILGTPTGSGKTLVALGAQLGAFARGQRTWYTAPIKALVSEKFFGLVEAFGADNVGMLTGDAAVNGDAPVICATAEVLAMLALRDGADARVDQVVMDEFHFYGDPDRGWAWQVPLLELPHTQFLLMSATLGDVSFFVDDLTRRTGRTTVPVVDAPRPVPLEYDYVVTPLHETVAALLRTADTPVYVVHPTQAGAVEQAQALTSVPLLDVQGQRAVVEQLAGVRFGKGFGGTLSRLLRAGIGVHHAGMLPRYRRLVERLAQQGLLTVICGTDTLGVGINVPIRTVLVTALAKFDGRRQRLLKAREFHQVAGRAGRAGFDVRGRVVVQAPEHEIENRRALAKAGDDPRKRRRVVRKKPAPGEVSWTEATFDRLVAAPPEPLTSRFQITHAMVLAVLARPGDPVAAMRHLIEDNHEPGARRHHVRRTVAIARSLLAAGVVERLDEPEPDGRRYRLTVDLQRDFALNQPLSPFAVAAVDLLDRDDPGYALDVLSVVESTLENPRPVLLAQRKAARGEAVAAMKADGIPYEERLERLDEITHPQPLAELLEHAYDVYASTHPWVLDTELRPKSVARDCFERAATFTEYVGQYGLSRSEGVLLRYLADAAKALRQTVPQEARTDDVTDLTEWLTEMVRQTDSSLLDEWTTLLDTDTAQTAEAGHTDDRPPPVTANTRAFRVLVRNEMFRRVQALSRGDYVTIGVDDADAGWTAQRYADALAPYWDEHDAIGTGPDARGPDLFLVEEGETTWRVMQRLDDPAGHRDWALVAEVDLAASDEAGTPVVRVLSLADIALA